MNNIITYLTSTQADFLDDLVTLVNCDCGTFNKAGVDQVGEWVQARCETWGWKVQRFPLTEYGDCWLARLRGRGKGRLLLMGHLDTVYPNGTATLRPMRFEGSKIVGPGVCDMKGGLLVGLYALRALQISGFDNFAELTFFFNSEEEMGSPLSRSFYNPVAQSMDAVLVLESARQNGDIVCARKGSGLYQVSVKGKAAHAGVEIEKGANAILELAHQIIAFHKLHGLVPGVTVSAGLIQGGIQYNVVPDEAWVELDVRAENQEGVEALRDAVAGLAGHTTVPGTQVDIKGDIHYPPMSITPAVTFLVELAQGAAQELGFTIKGASTGGASDANLIANLGLPVLDGLGPVGGLDHSPDEYIEKDSLVPRTAMLAGLIQRILAERDNLSSRRDQK